MFISELSFIGNEASTELVLVRRPVFVLGADQGAHLVVDDATNLPFDLLVTRDLGRGFRCQAINIRVSSGEVPSFLQSPDKVFQDEIKFVIGRIKVHLFALDSDLLPSKNDGVDVAGVHLLQRALGAPSPRFPFLEVSGPIGDFLFSFQPDLRISIGRASDNDLRLDAPEISSHHARIGCLGSEFWIEDLGSTNGTCVGDIQISSRATLSVGQPTILARSTLIIGRNGIDPSNLPDEKGWFSIDSIGKSSLDNHVDRSDSDMSSLGDPQLVGSAALKAVHSVPNLKKTFPALISTSEVVRPGRLRLQAGTEVRIGRDPTSDLWVGAPYISRLHCIIVVGEDGRLFITDRSTNGTFHEYGLLPRGAELVVAHNQPKVLSLGDGITIGICFSEQDEKLFSSTNGSPFSFVKSKETGGEGSDKNQFLKSKVSDGPKTLDREESSKKWWFNRLFLSLISAVREAGIPMLVLVGVSICFLLVLIVGLLQGIFLQV